MKAWRQQGQDEILHDGWRKVFKKTFLLDDGSEFIAEISDEAGSMGTACIALTSDNKVVIARQYRVGPGLVMDELPGGSVDHGEEPQMAAIRELREETGYEAGKVTYLGKIYKNAWMHTSWHYYMMEDCYLSAHGQQLEYGEDIEVVLMSISQLIENAKTGRMTDTEAVFLAYDHLRQRIKE